MSGKPRVTGRVLQTTAATGRLAMESLNLQNVPKAKDYSVPDSLAGSHDPALKCVPAAAPDWCAQ